MQKTTNNTSGVMGVLGLARQLNPVIGSYQEHYINEGFGYTVKVSNGGVRMSVEIAQDYEAMPSSVTLERVKPVADSFVKR